VGPSAVFTNDLHPRAESTTWELVETFVGPGASIGANATVVCGKPIGHHAMIAAGSVVTHEVAAHQLVAGNPARHLGWVCWCGQIISRDETEPTAPYCAEHGTVSFNCAKQT
jgi:tetrahydrodipicolinate N-succinyltransferase